MRYVDEFAGAAHSLDSSVFITYMKPWLPEQHIVHIKKRHLFIFLLVSSG